MDPTKLIEKFAAKSAKRADWMKWKIQLERFFKYQEYDEDDEEKKFNALLALGGAELEELYNVTPKTKVEKKLEKHPYAPLIRKPYSWAIERLEKHFEAGSNIQLEMSRFSELKQKDDERFEQYLIRLKQQAEYCEFGTKEEVHIIHQVNKSASSMKVRTKALEPNVTLLKLSAYAAQQEVIANSLEIEKKDIESGQVSAIQWNRNHNTLPMTEKFRAMRPGGQCYRCGSSKHTANLRTCPAINQKCNKCGRIGHFGRVCRAAKTVQRFGHVNRDTKPNAMSGKEGKEDENSEMFKRYAEIIHIVHSLENTGNEIITGSIGEAIVTFLIDSGSPIDCVTEEVWNEIQQLKVPIIDVKTAEQCNREFHSYATEMPLKVIARFSAKLKVGHNQCHTEFFVIRNARKSLISKSTGEKLGVLRVGMNIQTIALHNVEKRDFPVLPVTPVQLHIKESVTPVRQQYFRVPAAYENRTKELLNWMLDVGIIERVNEPSDWISPMLVVPKSNGDIRIVVDMRAANAAIERIYHPMPTLDQIRMKLVGTKIYSKLDLVCAYHHIMLDVKSRPITTFWSNIGLLRYRRVLFGLSVAPELFQGIMEQILCGVEGIIIYLDDILIAAKDMKEHDTKLAQVMEILEKNSLTLNRDKCEFRQRKLEFMGLLVCGEGIEISRSKVRAIEEFRRPQSIDEIRSFLGLVTYMSPFIFNLAAKTLPLRNVINGGKFIWSEEQEKAFRQLQGDIIDCTMKLGYFDVTHETVLYTDASGLHLGAVLVQIGPDKVPRVITCISRSLNQAEKNYPQVHREALAIVYAMKRLDYYLLGTKFKLLTDNLALKFIFNQQKDLSKRACNRAAMYALELQMFTFTVDHVPSQKNISDVLSRLYNGKEEVNAIDNIEWPEESCFAVTYERVKSETQVDTELKKLKEACENGLWNDAAVKSFRAFREEIYCWDNIMWKDDKIILPMKLRSEALKVAHLGHPGIVSMKRMLRDRVWWPNLDEEVKNCVKECRGCTLVERTDPPQPLKASIMPEHAWQYLAMDFFDAGSHNIHLLVIIDYHSRYLIAKIMDRNKTVEEVIKKLEEVFAQFDYPISARCDNGPPFNSRTFANYCTSRGILLTHSIPLWPQSNGLAEIQMKGIKRALQIAIAEKQDWKQALMTYISCYNKRPHSMTGKAPLELMMNRKVRNLLPDAKSNEIDKAEAMQTDKVHKERMKDYADRKRQAKESSIEKNDIVLMKNKRTDKLQTNFGATEYTIIDQMGKKSLVEGPNGEQYERCTTELKKVDRQQINKKGDSHMGVEQSDMRNKSTRIRKPNSRYEDFVE